MSERLESEKSELVLGINSFNKPAEKSGPDAWCKLITTLLFMKKGTYPSDPNMGCEIQQYDFAFIDDIINKVQANVSDQIQTYLPDIPLDSVSVTKDFSESGEPILLIVIEFTYNSKSDVVVVAAEKTDNLINFEVVM